MSGYSAAEAAERAGATSEEVSRLADLGIIGTDEPDLFTDADVMRIQVVQQLVRSGLPAEALGALVRDGRLSLSFIDSAGYHLTSALSAKTFAQLHEETGVPVDLLMAMREAVGGSQAGRGDRVREDEMAILPLVEYQHHLGFRPHAIERALRVYADSLRRIAEAEAEWWRSEIQEPMFQQGMIEDDVGRRAAEITPRLSEVSDQAVLAVYHAQQMHAWSTNIVGGIAGAMERAGLHTRQEQVPAICFLDIAGYTRLTQERGDSAAAELAERLGRIVQRASVRHGGRPVKWLGDGVMSYFSDPGQGVAAALEMVAEATTADLPPAHVGLHAGQVIFQEGDVYGQTVNVAARIGEYARPGEVLVSRAVVEASDPALAAFRAVGPVELKGVSGVIELYEARRADHAA